MVVRIRLSLHGRRGEKYFHIVAINSRKARNAKPLEQLGRFSQTPERLEDGRFERRVEWSVERLKYWLSTGAVPSDSVTKLLYRSGLLQSPTIVEEEAKPPATKQENDPRQEAIKTFLAAYEPPTRPPPAKVFKQSSGPIVPDAVALKNELHATRLALRETLKMKGVAT